MTLNQELRDAAEQMRSDHPGAYRRHAMWSAMAHLLEEIAAEGWTDEDFRGEDFVGASLLVAREYMTAAWSKEMA